MGHRGLKSLKGLSLATSYQNLKKSSFVLIICIFSMLKEIEQM